MGIVPIWGFQLITAIALAFLFRLNKAIVIVAANISIPPMIPVILFLSHLAGGVWMGDRAVAISFSKEITREVVRNSLIQYVLGAITLALVAGLVFSAITFVLLKVFRRPSIHPDRV